ncbi:MAG: restriction endonuclease, partial [Methanobacteriota archaeon]
MHMTELVEILSHVFRAKRYEVERDVVQQGTTGTTYKVPILATRAGHTFFVQVHPGGGPVSRGAVETLVNMAKDCGVDGALYVSLGEFTFEAEETACTLGVELWPRSRLEWEVGHAVVSGLVASPFHDTSPTAT